MSTTELLEPSSDPRWSPTARGCGIVVLIAGATFGSNVIGKELTQGSSAAVPPFLLVYFNVSWDTVAFALAGACDPAAPRRRHLTTRRIMWVALALMLLYQIGNVLYFVALSKLDVSTASLIYQSTTLWVAVFSVFLLGESFDPVKAGAVTLTLAGIATIVVDGANGESSSGADGSDASSQPLLLLLLSASAVAWALYEVLVKRLMPDATTTDLLLFTGWRGALNLLLLWPAALTLWVTGTEVVPALPPSVVGATCAMAAISVLSTFLIAAGIVETSPLYIRIANALVSPMSIAWDVARGEGPQPVCYLGASLIILGFALLNLRWRSARCVCRVLPSRARPLECGLAGGEVVGNDLGGGSSRRLPCSQASARG